MGALILVTINPSDEFDKLREKYPDEPAVVTRNHVDYDIKVVNDSLIITLSKEEETALIGENVTPYAKDQIYTSGFYKVSNVQANTITPDRRKWAYTPVEEFRTVSDNDNSVFYDDSEYISFTFPGVKKDTKTSLSYDVRINDPHFLGSNYFASYLPTEEVEITYTLDKGVHLKHFFFNLDTTSLERNKEEVGNRIKYTYRYKNLPKVEYEPDAPAFSYRAAHMSSLVESYIDSNGQKINILGDSDRLYKWYWTFIDGLKEENSPEVKRILNELLLPTDDELTKVKKVYYWVQENVKYIAFEDGMRGFVPHNGEYVCTKRYGDCKDMASIIINMLYHAGIDSHYTWVGTRDLPYKYSELPTASVDNHMIATYIHDGEYYYLDATAQYQTFGYPSSMIQGKEVLIGKTKNEYEIQTVPVIDKESNVHEDNFHYKLKDGNIVGSGKVNLKGYAKVFNSYRMINSKRQATDDYINRLLNRGNNKFFVDAYDIQNLQDLDLPISIDYDFRVEDYYREINGSIYLNMNLDKAFSNATIDKDRVHAIEQEYKYTNKSVSTLEIPEGYEVTRLPKDSEHHSDVFGYTMKYEVVESQVILKREFYLDYLLMEPKDFELWNDMIGKFTQDTKEILILKQK